MAVTENTPEHPREITLELIFRQGQRVLAELHGVRDEQAEQRARPSSIEHTLAQEFAHTRMEFVRLDQRLDRIHNRLERIERRLDLVEPVTPTGEG